MRFARVRRMLGPLEPPIRGVYDWGRDQVARARRRALVVWATGADHADQAHELSRRLSPGTVGVWVCCRTDVADLGVQGWFVVRLEPSTVRDPRARRAECRAVVASWRRVCRRVEVVDLDAPAAP